MLGYSDGPHTEPLDIKPLSPSGTSSSTARRSVSDSASSSDAPPRKRPRHDTSSSTASIMTTTRALTVEADSKASLVTRDSDFYFDDGSCVLQVENTLFNVHRTMLNKDSSSFGEMFQLPQGSKPAEGQTDDNPVYLPGDTAEEFRNFLWALYALPSELMTISSAQIELGRIIDIASVANKYSFRTTETWALDAIRQFTERKPSVLIPAAFPTPSSLPAMGNKDIIARLVRLAQKCGHARLLESMVNVLTHRMKTSVQFAYLAMTLGDEYDIRGLRGAGYLEVLLNANFVCSTDHSSGGLVEGDIQTEAGKNRLVISSTQRLRLLSGYQRLSKTWDRLRANAPQFDHVPPCSAEWHSHGCTQSWVEFWKEKTRSEAVLSLSSADVLGRLGIFVKEFDKWGSANFMHHECKNIARRSIHEKINSIREALPDYFHEGGDY
ncbi:hypothetical protein CONPUDRAFT_137261 [Coniophora puteana RWD-64-598 SS2]|uniref:BTB domain-containing protein n=1 Tax=Coniophora puteana (strain RWD-64-598) TaxID=741705 RepID=A0A5M3MPV5_CONPW|nr:uncharacterized protein CONPUDRAFT_137261 [Coniophora puteana RWD-64-598 SS2]EIW81209.1 hypothetical protein CONPUDRAFT_137261 [Coniophora puteana RWD-64-598 SS2]